MAGIDTPRGDPAAWSPNDVGIVVIGRNEGERLRRCLESVQTNGKRVVYVDSGSTDASVAMARARGVDVISLDLSLPFTAARARNSGLARLRLIEPELHFVQFVDGDCEIIDGWIASARVFLLEQKRVATVCGRLRERHPERSIYNRLCDAEWDRPAGPTDAVGGITMMRIDAFAQTNGYREDLVAGEEPDLCRRLRERGWHIWRLPQDMAWHDAAMLRFGQWWRRTRRIGYGYASALPLATTPSDRRAAWRRLTRPWGWAILLPLATGSGYATLGWPALLLLLLYPLQVLRTTVGLRGSTSTRLLQSCFLMLGKFPELIGQWQYWNSRRHGRAAPSFDYKS